MSDEREPDAGIEYRCAHCKGIFPHELTEAEAEAIFEEDFPGLQNVRRVYVCPDCYEEARKCHALQW